MDKPNNTPPPWSEAPPWAMWRCQEEHGYWKFLNKKPKAGRSYWLYDDGARVKIFDSFPQNPNWRETLQKRPENE